MCWATAKLDKGFDVNRSLPKGSTSHKFVTLNDKYFPNNGFPFAVYCGMFFSYIYKVRFFFIDRVEQPLNLLAYNGKMPFTIHCVSLVYNEEVSDTPCEMKKTELSEDHTIAPL